HPCREAVFSHVNSSIVDLGVIGVVDNKMRIRMLFGRPFWPLGPATGGKDQHTRADEPFHSSNAFMQETTCSGFSSSAISIVRFRSKVPATLRRSGQIAMLPARASAPVDQDLILLLVIDGSLSGKKRAKLLPLFGHRML